GDKIRNGEMCLMPNCGNHRNLRSEDRTRECLIVECSQIFERAASASDHDDVHFARFVEVANTGDHLRGCCFALDLCGINQQARTCVSAPHDVEHVVDGGATRRSNDADASRKC